MKKTVFTLLLAAGAFLSSNAKNDVEVQWNYDTSQSRMVQGDAHLYVRPFVVDLKLLTDERLSWHVEISGTEYESRLDMDSRGEINMENSQQNLQSYAIYKASVGTQAPIGHAAIKCDVIVAPLFNMTFNQNGCVIDFTGYPAAYTNWKSATLDEFERWIQYDRNQTDTKRTVKGSVGVQEVEVRSKSAHNSLIRK